MIDHNNIEEYIIDYIDGELSEEQIVALMDFLKNNNEYRQLLEAYRNTVIPEDQEIIFGNKESLLRPEGKKKALWLWPAAAVAAMLLVFLNIRRNTEVTDRSSTKQVVMKGTQGQKDYSGADTTSYNKNVAAITPTGQKNVPSTGNIAAKEKAAGKAIIAREWVQERQEHKRNDMELIAYKEDMRPERLDYNVSITMEYADMRPYKPHIADQGQKDRTVHFPLQDGSILVKDLKTQIETLKGRISQGLNDLSEMEITLFDKKLNKN